MNPVTRFACDRAARLAAIGMIFVAGCDRAKPPARADSIVSLSPAATGILLAMGVGDRVAGISTFDADPRVAALPRVGDYENVDWERIRAIAPRHLITQVARERLPPGFVEQATAISCSIRSIHIDRLDDVRVAIEQIGEELSDPAAARRTWTTIRSDLDAVARRVAERPKVKTLVAINDEATSVVGGATFVDDLLRIAGGQNALVGRDGYLMIDREQLAALDADAIVFLLPNATAEQQARARAAIARLPARPTPRTIVFVTRRDVLQPNAAVAQTADAIAAGLHRRGR